MRIGSTVIASLVACALLSGCNHAAPQVAAANERTELSVEEQKRTIDALRPPKRARPLVAVLGDNAGTETTDFLVPYGVLTESNIADVIAVAPEAGPIQLMPALTIAPQHTTAAFDRLHSDGADYVIVPAMHRTDNPAVLDWIRAQSATGAIVVGICSGAMVIAETGMLADHSATTHWFDIDALERTDPTLTRVDDRRYVVDRGIVTTTGVTASVPISLALVEAIGGTTAATALARRLGVDGDWSAAHDSAAFALSWRSVRLAVGNWLAFWRHETIGIEVGSGVDEVALAFTADAYSRTYMSKAVAVAEGPGAIRTKRGLELIPDHVGDAPGIDHVALMPAGIQPVRALDRVLDQIESRYGEDVATFVALQLEYPTRNRHLEIMADPRAGSAAR